jgi:hypothetical protein
MTSGINVPFFPNPPPQYDQRTMMQLVQAFSLFARQVQGETTSLSEGEGFSRARCFSKTGSSRSA